MDKNRLITSVFCVVTLIVLLCASPGQQVVSSAATAKVVRKQPIDPMNGTSLNVTLLQVVYEPRGASQPHTHPCPVIGYVLEGSVRIGIGSEPPIVYGSGQTFYESAGQTHNVSANASDTQRAVFLAYFLCDKETELSRPLKDSGKIGAGFK